MLVDRKFFAMFVYQFDPQGDVVVDISSYNLFAGHKSIDSVRP